MGGAGPRVTVPGCDAPTGTAGVYAFPDGAGGVEYRCRCVVCGRCGHHTGNSTQGHYWRFCAPARAMAAEFHFCCPGNCELRR